jgi:hypothetical protein
MSEGDTNLVFYIGQVRFNWENPEEFFNKPTVLYVVPPVKVKFKYCTCTM